MHRAEPDQRAPALTTTRSGPLLRGVLLTGLAVALLWIGMGLPSRLSAIAPQTFLRIPLLLLVFTAVMVAIRPSASRTRTILAVVLGILVGSLSILRLLDMGFREAIGRPFNPVVDWINVGSGASLLIDSVGQVTGVALIVLAGTLFVGILVAMPWAAMRVARAVARNRRSSGWATTALLLAWVGLAVGNVPVGRTEMASTDAIAYAYKQVSEIPQGIRDKREFAEAASNDPLSAIPDDQLLNALRGKDVLFVFVESYGRVALEYPGISDGIPELLDEEGARLGAEGFSARSAYLTSPTFGGISWLAHATFQSGLWADSNPRYDVLVASERLTLSHAFNRAGWRTVANVPANVADWDRRDFYDYDQLYDSRDVGYEGPKFGYATIPDQYTLETFQRLELAEADRDPVMAEIDLVSSHAPWAPLPSLVDPDASGDGSIYNDMAKGPSPSDAAASRAAYTASIQYSLKSVFSFLERHADDDTVLVMLGDHQPSTVISGDKSGKDVPISIVARDPAVLEQISSWNWDEGLSPGTDAPVTRMDTFRDEFLGAFNS